MRIEDANKGSFRGHGINTAQNHRIQMVLSTIMLISETGFLTQSSVLWHSLSQNIAFNSKNMTTFKGKRCPNICYSFIIGPYVSLGELKVY